jgi:hypothetical protein
MEFKRSEDKAAPWARDHGITTKSGFLFVTTRETRGNAEVDEGS